MVDRRNEIDRLIDDADAEQIAAMTGQGFRLRRSAGPHGYAMDAGPRSVRGGLGRQGVARAAVAAVPPLRTFDEPSS